MKSDVCPKNCVFSRTFKIFLLGIIVVNRLVHGAPQEGVLSLEKAVADTFEKHPDILLSHERLNESRAQKKRAYSEVFPKLSSSLSALSRQDAVSSPSAQFGGDTYNVYSLAAELSQPIFTSGAISSGIEYYSQEIEVREIDLSLVKREMTQKVISAYFALALAQKQFETMKRLKGIQESLLRTAENRYRIGNEQSLTVQQIKTNLLLLEPQVSSAENLIKVRASELASLTQNTDLERIEIFSSLQAPEWDALTKELRKDSQKKLEILRNEVLTNVLASNQKLRLSAHYPNVYLFGTWGRSGTEKADIFDSDSSAWSLGLKLSVPLFSGLSSVYDRRVLSSLVAQNRLQGAQIQNQNLLEKVKSEKEISNAMSLLVSSERALKSALESVKTAERTYKLGTATYLQVSDTQQKYTNAELSYEQAQFDLIFKMTQVFVAHQWPLEKLVQALSQSIREKAQTSTVPNPRFPASQVEYEGSE